MQGRRCSYFSHLETQKTTVTLESMTGQSNCFVFSEVFQGAALRISDERSSNFTALEKAAIIKCTESRMVRQILSPNLTLTIGMRDCSQELNAVQV
jgi:hypothetical protein